MLACVQMSKAQFNARIKRKLVERVQKETSEIKSISQADVMEAALVHFFKDLRGSQQRLEAYRKLQLES